MARRKLITIALFHLCQIGADAIPTHTALGPASVALRANHGSFGEVGEAPNMFDDVGTENRAKSSTADNTLSDSTELSSAHAERDLEKLSTIALSTFLLELTIQRRPNNLRHLQRHSTMDRNIKAEAGSHDIVDQSVRELQSDVDIELFNSGDENVFDTDNSEPQRSADELIQKLAQDHLTAIYAETFTNIPPPSQVLLTVVTAEDSDSTSSGIFVRQSFVGGVVSFPIKSSKLPSRDEMERATLDAFVIPGKGERFLSNLLLEGHEDLDGLLLLSAREIERDGSGGYETINGGGNSIDESSSATSTMTMNESGSYGMNNIWAIAAVAALGAMFVTIILCTTILYCDWRKRRHHHNNYGQSHKRLVSRNGKHSVTSDTSGQGELESALDMAEIGNGFPTTANAGSQADPSLRVVVPSASAETEESRTPSPSSQGSEEIPNANNVTGISNGSGNGVGRGSLINSLSMRKNSIRNHTRTSSVGRVLSKSKSITAKPKSKAAENQLQSAEGPVEDESYTPEAPPSVTYSVGEDTTVLYPNMNRGRTSSKDSRDNESFDGYSVGYSVDAASTLENGQYGQYSQKGGSHVGGKSTYSGEIARDFDSVWDDESKMTASMAENDIRGTYNGGMTDDDTLAGMSEIESSSPSHHMNIAMPAMDPDPLKESYGDLSKNLNQLVESEYKEKYGENTESVDESKPSNPGPKLGNLYEVDSSSESGSSRGVFTLELLGAKPKNISNRQSSDRSQRSEQSGADFDSESESGSNRGAFTLELLGQMGSKKQKGKSRKGRDLEEDEDSILGDMYSQGGMTQGEESATSLEQNQADVGEGVPSSGDSVDSTPSWAAPIESAKERLKNAENKTHSASSSSPNSAIFRASAPSSKSSPLESLTETKSDDTSIKSKDQTKEKLLSSLSGKRGESMEKDDGSTASNKSALSSRSNVSHHSNVSNKSSKSSQSNVSKGSIRSTSSRGSLNGKSGSTKLSRNSLPTEATALGTSQSVDSEVDDDPTNMIESINSMLSECRVILDTEKSS